MDIIQRGIRTAGQIIETTIEASPFKNTGIRGPKIDYYNIGHVGWQGVNGLAEYSGDKITGVLQVGLSNQSFQREICSINLLIHYQKFKIKVVDI